MSTNRTPAGTGDAAEDGARPSRAMTPGRLGRLCRKELREILRDRRTIVTLVLMPLLVYPLLTITFQRFFLQSLVEGGATSYIYGVESNEAARLLDQAYGSGNQWLKMHEESAAGSESPSGDPASAAIEALVKPAKARDIQVLVEREIEKRLTDGAIDVAILIEPYQPAEQPPRADGAAPPDPADDATPQDDDNPAAANPPGGLPAARFKLVYRRGSATSREALAYLERRLNAANDRYVHLQLERLGVDPRPPLEVEAAAVDDSETFFSLTTVIPLILILMTITGAVYPAIDLTAGERERGTLETLMAAPVPRGGLLLAKYVAVLTVALLTATANLIAMTATLSASGLAGVLLGDKGFSPLVVAEVFGLMALFAAFFSAVVLALTSFARSFKEAQAYLIPLMLVCLAPGLLSLMPGLELSATLAIVPLVNVVLLARDVLSGTASGLPAVVAAASTLLYALASIGIAARVFGSDSVLYGSQGAWSDLVRRPARPRTAATLPGALLCLALLFPCTYLVSGTLIRLSGDSVEWAIALSGVATLLIFGALPGLFAYAQHVEATPAYRAYPPSPLALAAAVVLGISVWPLAHELFLLGEMLGLGGLNAEKLKWARDLLDRWRSANPAVILIFLALIPAMCEEWFFRGYLFSALLEATRPWLAIVVSALLFGLFHVVAGTMLSTERFLPTALLGLLLGLLCWRSGSVVPGIVMHVLHNGLLLLISIYQEQLVARGWGVMEGHHMPAAWLAAATVGVTLALGLLWFVRPPVSQPGDSADRMRGERALS